MRFVDYSHRHGRELLRLLQPEAHAEIISILGSLPPFPHGTKKGTTVKAHMATEFIRLGWISEGKAEFSAQKHDAIDLWKSKVAIEMEWSRFEMFFRDFFRFMLLYEQQRIDAGVIITYDEMAYQRWSGEAKAYRAARASFHRLTDFLKGDYSTIVRVPLWCIGIE